jgi:uncharacterized metal-binding protein YceD (DUF177 family)
MESLKIYIDRLKGGQTQKIDEILSPDFLDIHEEDLLFKDPIKIQAEVYIADAYLVIHLTAETRAYLPCSICNEPVQIPVAIKQFPITQELSEIKGAIFDLEEKIRETILLQVPLFIECHQGKCPERENIKRFLKPDKESPDSGGHHYLPFSELK